MDVPPELPLYLCYERSVNKYDESETGAFLVKLHEVTQLGLFDPEQESIDMGGLNRDAVFALRKDLVAAFKQTGKPYKIDAKPTSERGMTFRSLTDLEAIHTIHIGKGRFQLGLTKSSIDKGEITQADFDAEKADHQKVWAAVLKILKKRTKKLGPSKPVKKENGGRYLVAQFGMGIEARFDTEWLSIIVNIPQASK